MGKIGNILVLSKNRENWRSGYYHQDLIDAVHEFGEVFLYGPGYPKYEEEDGFEEVITKSPWREENIDLVIVSTSWEIEDPEISESDPHPEINLAQIDTPKIFFLNKEYKKIDQKIDYINKNKFDLVVTVLPESKYQKWEARTNAKFIQSHFGINLKRFKNLNLERAYDIGFTGALHREYTSKRFLIKKELFKERKLHIKSNRGLWRIISLEDPIKRKYSKYNIYWAEWDFYLSRDFLGRNLLPFEQRYVKLLNRTKLFLNTLSANNTFNQRFFELMATKTLIFCPEDDYYELLKDGRNCVMFKNDFSDFEEKLKKILKQDKLRKKIVERAYKDIGNHTFEERLRRIFKILSSISPQF